jgi:pimeloyl-ACP methyl ester carboxylesterase
MLHYRNIDANGLRFAVAEQGTGPLVLLCHGFPETSYAWRHQIAALAAAGYRAVAPDLRGYGGTDSPADLQQYTVWHLVGDLVGILDALGEARAVVVGNDWGATIAWHAALLRPDRFRAVAGIGVPMMGRAPRAPSLLFPRTEEALFYTLYFQEPGVAERELEADLPATLRKLLFAGTGEAGLNPFGMVDRAAGMLAPLPDALPDWLTQDDLDVYAQAFARSGLCGALNWYRNLDRNWELQAALEGMRVTVPALYLAGERDPGLAMPGMRAIVDAMPALVPDLRGSVMLPCGHWVPQEAPALVNDALLGFLRQLD